MTLKSMLELAEHFNAVTLGKPAEYWEEKNDAMIKLAKSILEYTDAPSATIAEAFNAKFFRLLKDPIKQMVRLLFHGACMFAYMVLLLVDVDIGLAVSAGERGLPFAQRPR
jgi:hypothetical protein